MIVFLIGLGIGFAGHWAFDKFALPAIKEKIANWVK